MDAVLITGGTGQLAGSLGALRDGFARIGLAPQVVGRPGFDFDRPDGVAAAFRAAAPALVVNAAAWTGVDAAEGQPEAADRANHMGPALLARLCAGAGIPLIHVSTDYVFDGRKGAPYVESDPTSPTGVYGRTKLLGEEAALAACDRTVVLRTSWVYAATGRNFVRTMLRAARERDRLRVVADQRGCPTSADDLAAAILGIAARLQGGWRGEYAGVFHAAGTGEASWHGFAEAIFAAASRHGWPVPAIDAISTADWPTPARRPADSRLDCTRMATVFEQRLSPWQESLPRIVDRICGADPAHGADGGSSTGTDR